MKHRNRRRLRSAAGVALIAAPVVGLLGSPLVDPLDAQQDRDVPVHNHDDHDHGLTYTPMGVQFPPQPADLDNVRWHGTGAMTPPADRHAGQVRRVQQEGRLRQAIGDRFELISSQPMHAKGQASDGRVLLTYMSHSNNRVVEAAMRNGELLSVESSAPKDYQPPLGPGEMDEAIRMAGESFRSDGVSRVDALEGYAILALPTTEGVAFHNHRVAYVTFTATADVRPEYGAYVDLTDGTVLRKAEL